MKSISKFLKQQGLDINSKVFKVLFYSSSYSQRIFEIHPGRRNPLGEETESQQLENGNIEARLFKSIDNSKNNIAFLHYLPTSWEERDITDFFDRKGETIDKVIIVRNRLGNATGKALIEFKSELMCEEFIKKWHENFIETKEFTQKIVAKSFNLKKNSEKTVVKNKHRTVYLKSIDFDATVDDIYKIASDFGEVVNMDLPMKKGKNLGYGFVHFKNVQDAENFQQYFDERIFMGRKLSAQLNEYRFDTQKRKYGLRSDDVLDRGKKFDRSIHQKEALNLYNEMLLDDEIKITPPPASSNRKIKAKKYDEESE